ncbi:NUDIX domain-containing protein [Glaciihabitans arcticus]|uniref:NUDIX domain-containing protein n=1 Tax=Glaciihabitans arcticus TaxID=2668039 RepID=A0A4Q9GWS0_9MICO|nr:NUDIX domain-containing protein [Glaciihabitans arcticus]TBN57667.1 NUDIX domain-containing protein [Glaciihabitans arcticus]
MTLGTQPVLAAGAVCWRLVDGKARILLVHRAGHADVSLPKGKLDPGETLPQTAVREILEETGLGVSLGAPLGTVEYTLPSGREKIVYYWSCEVDDHALQLAKFTPNSEIAALEWATLGKARKKLTYAHDIDVIDRFAERLKAGRARTFAIVALRHGKTVSPSSWDGPDATRPLLQRGTEQAQSLATGLAAFAPEKLVSSTAVRCLSTIAPLAGHTGLGVIATDEISQDAFESGTSAVGTVVGKRIRKQKTTVLCSHGPVLPEIIAEIAKQTNTLWDRDLEHSTMLDTGGYTVLHISRENPSSSGIVAIETHG